MEMPYSGAVISCLYSPTFAQGGGVGGKDIKDVYCGLWKVTMDKTLFILWYLNQSKDQNLTIAIMK